MATPDITARPLEWNPPRQAISRVPYLPGLDGMRALAVVAVMLYHTNNGWLPGGFIGVEVFFVISGYLITLLLIGEHEKTGHIDLKQFWIRRAKRLLPALFLMMALLMVYSALFERDTLGKLRGDVLAGLGYITNWYQIWIGAGYTSQARLRAAAPPVEPGGGGAVLPRCGRSSWSASSGWVAAACPTSAGGSCSPRS